MSEEFKSTENSNQGDLRVVSRNENYGVIVIEAEGKPHQWQYSLFRERLWTEGTLGSQSRKSTPETTWLKLGSVDFAETFYKMIWVRKGGGVFLPALNYPVKNVSCQAL